MLLLNPTAKTLKILVRIFPWCTCTHVCFYIYTQKLLIELGVGREQISGPCRINVLTNTTSYFCFLDIWLGYKNCSHIRRSAFHMWRHFYLDCVVS